MIRTISTELVKRYEAMYAAGTVFANYASGVIEVNVSVPLLDDKLQPQTRVVKVAEHNLEDVTRLAAGDQVADNDRVNARVDRALVVANEFVKSEFMDLLRAKFAKNPVENIGFGDVVFSNRTPCSVTPSAPTTILVNTTVGVSGTYTSVYAKKRVAITRLAKGNLDGDEFDETVRAALFKALDDMTTDALSRLHGYSSVFRRR